ncbi:hypothetical protein FA95DRAFT_1601296 [Auriscalpium vulgare]|uniref:Uncharacterized protein n=1 Tax=Auriscalpium vulgare TaxID=40419 RepID=A0ACB8SAH7_9AGAM|nr:hypothetical protein FA95DRAFT_1601296 [Auriscalpium vulgare]
MSAKWNIKPPNLPALPHEVWLDIFRLATAVPGIFDGDVEDPFDSPAPAGGIFIDTRAELRALRTALVTKRYLVRVCARWRALARPLLYEALWVGRPHVLVSLAGALRASEELAGGALGWHVRRLDIACVPGAEREHLLADIVRRLPRLRVLCVSARRGGAHGRAMPAPVMAALGATCGGALRKVWWDDDADLQPAAPDVRALLHAAPGVRALVGVRLKVLEEPAPLVHRGLRFAAVPLPLRYNPQEPARLPALRQVFFDIVLNGPVDAYVVDWDGHRARSAVPAPPPALTTVYVRLHIGVVLQPLMASLGLLPDVPHLVLVGVGAITFSDANVPAVRLPPSVTHFGVHLARDQASNRYYRRLFAFLAALAGPALRVVRLLNARAVEDLTVRHAARLREGIRTLASQPFRLEDHRGRAFGDDEPSLGLAE